MLSKNTQKSIKLKGYTAGIAYAALERKRIKAELKRLRTNNDKKFKHLRQYLDEIKCYPKTSKN